MEQRNQERLTLAFVYLGTPQEQIDFVDRTQGKLDTLSPAFLDVGEGGQLQVNISPELVQAMGERDIQVVPLLSNHWNRQAGVDFLQQYQANAGMLAQLVRDNDLDGVMVDLENLTHDQREQYSNFVRALNRQLPDKVVSVAIAPNPSGWNSGWHGSYDYARLANNTDYLYLMAYDESYEGGPPGPVASLGWVENSLRYALRNIPSHKLVLGVPFFGRLWGPGQELRGLGVGMETIRQLIQAYDGQVEFDQGARVPHATFTIPEGGEPQSVGGQLLVPGDYQIWYEDDQSIQEKLALVEQYNLLGAGFWSLGQEDPALWTHIDHWIDATAATAPARPADGWSAPAQQAWTTAGPTPPPPPPNRQSAQPPDRPRAIPAQTIIPGQPISPPGMPTAPNQPMQPWQMMPNQGMPQDQPAMPQAPMPGQGMPRGIPTMPNQAVPPRQMTPPGQPMMPPGQPMVPQNQPTMPNQTVPPGQMPTPGRPMMPPGQPMPPQNQPTMPNQAVPPRQMTPPGQPMMPPGQPMPPQNQPAMPNQGMPRGIPTMPNQTAPPRQMTPPGQPMMPPGQPMPPQNQPTMPNQAVPPGQPMAQGQPPVTPQNQAPMPNQGMPRGIPTMPNQAVPPRQMTPPGQPMMPPGQSMPPQNQPTMPNQGMPRGIPTMPNQAAPPRQMTPPGQPMMPPGQPMPPQNQPTMPNQGMPRGIPTMPNQTAPPQQMPPPGRPMMPNQGVPPRQTVPMGQPAMPNQAAPSRQFAPLGQPEMVQAQTPMQNQMPPPAAMPQGQPMTPQNQTPRPNQGMPQDQFAVPIQSTVPRQSIPLQTMPFPNPSVALTDQANLSDAIGELFPQSDAAFPPIGSLPQVPELPPDLDPSVLAQLEENPELEEELGLIGRIPQTPPRPAMPPIIPPETVEVLPILPSEDQMTPTLPEVEARIREEYALEPPLPPVQPQAAPRRGPTGADAPQASAAPAGRTGREAEPSPNGRAAGQRAAQPPEPEVQVRPGRVTGGGYLNVRTGPSVEDQVITRLRDGTQVRVVGERNGWYQIVLYNGRVGYVSGRYIQLE